MVPIFQASSFPAPRTRPGHTVSRSQVRDCLFYTQGGGLRTVLSGAAFSGHRGLPARPPDLSTQWNWPGTWHLPEPSTCRPPMGQSSGTHTGPEPSSITSLALLSPLRGHGPQSAPRVSGGTTSGVRGQSLHHTEKPEQARSLLPVWTPHICQKKNNQNTMRRAATPHPSIYDAATTRPLSAHPVSALSTPT